MSTTSDRREGLQAPTWGFRKGASVFTPLCLCTVLASGCLRAQAKALPAVPLAMPVPPSRVVEVTDPQSPPIVSLPEEPVRDTPLRRPPPPPRRSDVRVPETVKPEAPVDAQKATDDPARASAAPTTLQTTTTQLEGQVERQIRLLLAQAVADLNRIDAQGLNADARTQFDIARRFVSQAEEALRSKNLVFANNLAEKASVLAAQLAGR